MSCSLPCKIRAVSDVLICPLRLDPPGQAISTATQELLRLAEANPNGIATLDPVNDLHLKGVEVVEGVMRQRVLVDSLKDFKCIHSPTFSEQVCSLSRLLLSPVFLLPFFFFSLSTRFSNR